MAELNQTGCGNSFDCPGNLICYPQNVAWNPGVNSTFCDCHHDYGWERESLTDENCLLFGPQTYAHLAASIILVTAGLSILIASTCSYVKYSRRLATIDKRLTFAYAYLSIALIVAWRALYIYQLYVPELATTPFTDGAGSTKEAFAYESVAIILLFASVFYFFALINVGLVWMNLLKDLSFMFDGTNDIFPCFKNCPRTYREASYVVQFIAFIFAFIAVGTSSVEFYTVAGFGPLVLIMIMFYRGRVVLTKVLLEVTDENARSAHTRVQSKKYLDLLRLIRLTATVIIVTVVLSLLLNFVIFFAYTANLRNVPPSNISFIYSVVAYASFFNYIANGAIIWYLFGTGKREEEPTTVESNTRMTFAKTNPETSHQETFEG